MSDSLILEETDDGIYLHGKEKNKLSSQETYRNMAAEDEDWNDMNEPVSIRLSYVPSLQRYTRQWHSRFQIQCAGKDIEIAVDQVRTISKRRLKNKIDKLSAPNAIQLRRIIVEIARRRDEGKTGTIAIPVAHVDRGGMAVECLASASDSTIPLRSALVERDRLLHHLA